MIDAGGLSNSVTADALDPASGPVSDISDDDGTGASDPTVTTLTGTPALTAVKSATLNLGGDGQAGAGDSISYSYTVANAGNVTLFDIALAETGFTGTGTLPVPALASGGANLGGNAGVIDLAVGGSATFTAPTA